MESNKHVFSKGKVMLVSKDDTWCLDGGDNRYKLADQVEERGELTGHEKKSSGGSKHILLKTGVTFHSYSFKAKAHERLKRQDCVPRRRSQST